MFHVPSRVLFDAWHLGRSLVHCEFLNYRLRKGFGLFFTRNYVTVSTAL